MAKWDSGETWEDRKQLKWGGRGNRPIILSGQSIFPMPTVFVLLLFLFMAVHSQSDVEDQLWRVYKNYKNWKQNRAEYVHLSRDYPLGWTNFHCDYPSVRGDALDVHTLAPWNVDVVVSLGDSLSAGRATAAEHLEDLLTDYPGVAFVSGGNKTLKEEATLYNIFQHFNPKLVIDGRNINIAKSGSFSSDLPRQVVELEKRLRASKEIDFENDWKFINIFIGSNDLCKICSNETEYNPDKYYQSMKRSLQFIKENIPRSFVNVMPPLNIQILLDTHKNPFCLDFHQVYCSCLLWKNTEEFAEEKNKFDEMLFKAVDDVGETDTFAAAVAPTIASIRHIPVIGSLPNIAFPALDCFHFSVMASDMVAKLIWRSLFEPVGSKDRPSSFDDFNPKLWDCPPPGCPFFRTARNTPRCMVEKVRYPSLPEGVPEFQTPE